MSKEKQKATSQKHPLTELFKFLWKMSTIIDTAKVLSSEGKHTFRPDLRLAV
jgi:hypothetical protein